MLFIRTGSNLLFFPSLQRFPLSLIFLFQGVSIFIPSVVGKKKLSSEFFFNSPQLRMKINLQTEIIEMLHS